MKKTLLLLAFIISLLLLHSCEVNSVVTFHKDGKSSLITEIDYKELAEIAEESSDSEEELPIKKKSSLSTKWENIVGYY